MTHLWVRAEQRPFEVRVGLTPEGAAALRAAGIAVTVEQGRVRAIPPAGFEAAGCAIALKNWAAQTAGGGPFPEILAHWHSASPLWIT